MTKYMPWAFIVLPLMLCIFPAHAQTTVKADQGRPGNQGPWPVVISGSAPGAASVVSGPDGGAVIVQDLPCTNPVETVILYDGGAATPIPISPLVGRRTVTICNSPKNSGSPKWTIRSDGAAPTTALSSPGQTLNVSDCVSYLMGSVGVDGGNPINGISDTGSAAVTTTECK